MMIGSLEMNSEYGDAIYFREITCNWGSLETSKKIPGQLLGLQEAGKVS